MIEKIRNAGWTVAGIAMMIVVFFVLVAFIRGGVWVTETYMDLMTTINGWVTAVMFICLLLSVIPRIRIYTGLAIYWGANIWTVIFWLFCLFVTYEMWGLIGVLIGLFFAGIGIFATAILSIFFDGQASAAAFMLLNLLLIFGARFLGYWIATKHREGPAAVIQEDQNLVS